MQLHYPHGLLLLAPLIHLTTACVIYTATSPFSSTLPFQATITDNNLIACSLSMSYTEHSALQTAYSLSHARELSLFPSTNTSSPPRQSHPLTSSPPLYPSTHGFPPPGFGNQKMPTPPYDELDDWIPWTFECLEGHKAHANVGLRTLVYEVRGKEFFLVPEMREDIWGEEWVFGGGGGVLVMFRGKGRGRG